MKVEIDLDEESLIAVSRDICRQLADANIQFQPVEDPALIARLAKTGLIECGLIENEDGYWTVGRRDGDHVLIAYKPL